jgi:sulfite dehydrogenase (cytochrome) subunit B
MRGNAMNTRNVMKTAGAALALALMAAPIPAGAEEQSIELKNASGKEVVEGNCGSCHSLDYIQMNSPFLDGKKWEITVGKMIKIYHAPVSEEDAKQIVEYLSKNYGS